MTVRSESTAEKYHFIVPLWGAKFVDMFVNYSLPSQLSPGNLPALPAGMTTYEIFTSPDDVEAIANSDSVQKLRSFVDVSIKTFRDEDVMRELKVTPGRYVQNLQKMTWCYQQALAGCRGVDAAFVFMTPDSVWADGAFRFMHDCQSAGVRALMALGLITVRPLLQSRLADFAVPEQGVLELPPRQLVTLACDTLHPLGISRVVRNGSARWNSAFYWMRHGRGMVARCFYLHPVMVRPRVHLERMPCTVDYRYVQQACPDVGDVRVVTDSDDLFYVDMADLEHVGESLQMESVSEGAIADWMCEWTDDYHRAYFRQPIVLREEDGGDDDTFADELTKSRAFADALLERHKAVRNAGGKPLWPSNVFAAQDIRPEAPPPSARPFLLIWLLACWSLLKQAAALANRSLRWVIRTTLFLFFRRFYVRIEAVERALEKNQEEFGCWKAHLIRLEYDLSHQMAVMRAKRGRGPFRAPVDPSDSARVAG